MTNTKCCANNTAIFLYTNQSRFYIINRNRKANASFPVHHDSHINANHLTIQIYKRTAAVFWINRRIGLKQIR